MDIIRAIQSRMSRRSAEISKLELLTRWTRENLKSARRALRGAMAEYYILALELRIHEMRETYREENSRRVALGKEQKLDREVIRTLRAATKK